MSVKDAIKELKLIKEMIKDSELTNHDTRLEYCIKRLKKVTSYLKTVR